MEAATERDFTGERIKHLEMIQGVIARMANSSAWMKRFAIIVVGGAAALAVRGDSGASALLALAAALLTAILWLMDARYLQQERWFRTLFDDVRKEGVSKRSDFRMKPSEKSRSQSSFLKSLFSWSIFPYYGLLIALLLLLFAWSAIP